MQDFLQRCLESPFSRKLDLWSFLDIPRSRLVKYPLLLKEILRHTPSDHPDTTSLEIAVSMLGEIHQILSVENSVNSGMNFEMVVCLLIHRSALFRVC